MSVPSFLIPKKKVDKQKNSELSKIPDFLKPKETLLENKENKSDFFKEQAQQFASSKPVQVALGLTQGVTYPLDLIKMYLSGEMLLGIEEAEEASQRLGIPFDKQKAIENSMKSLEYFPTQSLAEDIFEKETDISTKPKDRFSKVLRFLSEFGSLSPKGQKIPKLHPKQLGPEEESLRKTAEEFGLKKIAGMESEKPPMIRPVVSENKQKKLVQELGETSKNAIDKIIENKVPIKKMRDSGVNLENAYTSAYETANNTAKKMGNQPVDFSDVIDWINIELKKTKSSAPSLSKQQKTYIDILSKEKRNLLQNETQKIDLITGKKIPPKTKPVTATQSLTQYKNYNDNVKGIWKKPEFSGVENTVKNAYAGLNSKIIESIEKTNPNLGNELKFANKIFHENSKLEQVEGILSKSFKDGYNANRLSKTLSNNRERRFLERNLGKDGIQDLESIAKYGQQAEKRVFEQIKNPVTVKEYLNNITPTQLALLVGFKAHAGAAYYIPKSIIHRIQGNLFTRESTKKDYIKFLKEASQLGKNPAPLFLASKKLQKSIKEEFGSEKELLDLSSESE